ncbi:MAG: HigA family addiction module antitoxin [Acidobacteriota bacterium]
MRMFDPPHPGLLLREYMGDTLTVAALAKHLGMTRANLSMILNGRMSISASVAVKLSEAFPNSDPELWLGLQAQYDLAHVRKRKRTKIQPVLKQAA